ncbi:MAG: cytochrome c [Chloroflexota bacterium]
MDDLRKITYGVLIGFVLMLAVWIGYLTLRGCGSGANCAGAVPTAVRTSIPTLIPATQPALVRLLGAATAIPVSVGGDGVEATAAPTESVLRPTNPGGPGEAINLSGDAAAGRLVFELNCQICHNVEGRGGNPNPGSTEATIPALNPIDPRLKSEDYREMATNLDLFIEHGSVPPGPNPTFSMLAWGDDSLLAPQQIADVIAYIIQLNP